MAGKLKVLKDKKKVQQGKEEYLRIKRYAQKYLTSPGFKQRLLRRLDKLNGSKWFGPWHYTLNPKYLDKTVLNLLEGDGSSWANADTNTLNMTDRGAFFRQTMAHEMGHLIDNGVIKIYKRSPTWNNWFKKDRMLYSSIYPELRKNPLTEAAINNGVRPNAPMTKKQNDTLYSKYRDTDYDANNSYHDAFEQEPYADFFQMRYELDRLGLYDSTRANNPFTKEILDKFREKTNSGNGVLGGYHYNMAIQRIFKNFEPQEIIDIMNNVAEIDPSKLLKEQLSPDPSQAYYAKKGTRLIKKPIYK